MRSFKGVGALAALAVATTAATADARSHRRARLPVVPIEEPVIEVAPLPPVAPSPIDLIVGALTTNVAASSYNNPFYGYGTYYAPPSGTVAAQPGYGYFGY